MQMLLYLFAICKTTSESFKKSMGFAEGDEIKPASVMYISTKIPLVDASGGASEEDIFKMASKHITRDGLILNDDTVITALNKLDDPKYIMNVKSPKSKSASSILTSSEEFTDLERLVNATISDIVHEMRSGNASADPLQTGDKTPCEYCKMKQFCRIDKEKPSIDEGENEDGEEE